MWLLRLWMFIVDTSLVDVAVDAMLFQMWKWLWIFVVVVVVVVG